MKRIIGGVLLLLLLLMTSACGGGFANQTGDSPAGEKEDNQTMKSEQKMELMVLAAASLTDALNELKEMYERNHPGMEITYVFGSSGTLAQQLEQGAPADLFISASEKFMDQVENKGLLMEGTRKEYVQNELVLIAPKKGRKIALEQLNPTDVKQFAIGDPKTVPAGSYAQEVLMSLGKWVDLQGKMVYGKDVRQVLAYVETGNVDYGMVFRTDALISKDVVVLDVARPEWHKPISYPIALIKDSMHEKEARDFYQFLLSGEGKKVVEKYGFK
ncbi:putative ABC transporter substrate-binding lipoprotein YvgL [[Clostridium] ultunense Esp]|nr:putative ABC transporter substrate-binding lipoprotein YvgL [[Clostridium] ultunense Esp]